MIGLAAQRKPNGSLIVVSPKDGIEFDIDEDLLNKNIVKLGSFCRIEVENNVPVSYSLVKKYGTGKIEAEVESDSVQINGITGILSSKLALFYKTKDFGEVACKDKVAGQIGTKHQLIISRLPENQRTGLYSRFVWQGVSDGIVEKVGKENAIEAKKTNKNSIPEEVNDEKDEEKAKVAKSGEKMPEKKHIFGFVVGKNQREQSRYVFCNLTYPGADGKVFCNKNNSVDVGDWVRLEFNKKEFSKYFPTNPKANTPTFSILTWRKIPDPRNYKVSQHGEVLEVRIKDYALPANHKSGDSIEDNYLGLVDDGNKMIRKGSETVDLVIRRRKPFRTSDGKWTVWFVKESRKSTSRSESPFSTERSSSNFQDSRTSRKTNKNQKKNEMKQNDRFLKEGSSQSKENGLAHGNNNNCAYPPGFFFGPPNINWQMGHPNPVGLIHAMGGAMSMGSVAAMPGYPGFVYPQAFMPPLAGCPPPFPKSERNQEAPRKPNTERVLKGEPVRKRAVVTSIKQNFGCKEKEKSQRAFLWLLDDHRQSVLLTSGEVVQERNNEKVKLFPGYFFDGVFQQDEEDRWECTRHMTRLGKLLEGSVHNGALEFQFVVNDYFPQSAERLNPETFHSFIGKIIDKENKLPKDCSSGVRIGIKLWNLPERGEWCWVVSKVFQSSKHVQLLMEFHQAWHKPGIRDVIRHESIKEFLLLQDLMDTKAENDEEHNKELIDNKDWKYAWVVVHDGDFIRMLVFPRVKGQGMNLMKKNVKEKSVYRKVKNMKANRLYRAKLNDVGDVVEMIDCEQHFYADKYGKIQFKIVSTDDLLLAKNVAVVEPIGVPECFGKLIFCYPDRPITKKKVLMQTTFRILDDKDAFSDNELVQTAGVCFINTGDPVEKLPNQNLEEVMESERTFSERKLENYKHNYFKNKLLVLHPKDEVFPMFKAVCSILRSTQILKELKKQDIDTHRLIKLQASI
ncbi:Protein CBG06240 [Caenorhabditis briggsae]|uniref:Protein CBG06240 n=1 Tax=Caenorhabditis briggsae TaxID=6238 RepID=A8X0K2_CAEBR|nr:Protein CBG06240 [Caenorhabditis briggsae]CAP26162.2 Protein CBG06240 [Caenorhabditis briggsae]